LYTIRNKCRKKKKIVLKNQSGKQFKIYFSNSPYSLRNSCLLLLIFIVRSIFIVVGSVETRQKTLCLLFHSISISWIPSYYTWRSDSHLCACLHHHKTHVAILLEFAPLFGDSASSITLSDKIWLFFGLLSVIFRRFFHHWIWIRTQKNFIMSYFRGKWVINGNKNGSKMMILTIFRTALRLKKFNFF